MASSRLITGAQVAVYINGKPYALVMGVRWNSDTAAHASYGIDAMEPFELSPTVSSVTGSLTVYRRAGDGAAEGSGITVPLPDLARELYFRVTLIELRTQKVIFNAPRCKITSQSWEVPTKGHVTGTLNFMATTWSNEAPRSSQ